MHNNQSNGSSVMKAFLAGALVGGSLLLTDKRNRDKLKRIMNNIKSEIGTMKNDWSQKVTDKVENTKDKAINKAEEIVDKAKRNREDNNPDINM